MKKFVLRAPILSFTVIILILQFSNGCKKFLDVNENPNNPVNASPELLLPTVEAAIGQIIGNNFQVYGNFWAQYWTQSPSASQYRSIDQYRVANTAFDRSWINLYRGALQNAQLIINNQTAGNKEIKGMAYILKAYSFQLATDAFGDIPLTEALQGNQISSPHYQRQQVVYDSIFNYLDTGIALLRAPGSISPGTQDILFNSDIDQWIRFARTLKLRCYLRLSQVEPNIAASGIAALYTSGGGFLETDASINYSSTGGNENPFYNESVGLGRTQNAVASENIVAAMLRNADPRLQKFYQPLPNADTVAYIAQGSYSGNSNKEVSPPSALVGGNANSPASATAPVKLISATESYFLQAEAVARGWATGNLVELFNNGIRASFESLSIITLAQAYIDSAQDAVLPGNVEGNVRAIVTQKYYALTGFQGFEAWTEWRRTGYPDFIHASAASTLGSGRLPLRFLYPNSEITTNQNFPGNQLIYTPVWWDVN